MHSDPTLRGMAGSDTSPFSTPREMLSTETVGGTRSTARAYVGQIWKLYMKEFIHHQSIFSEDCQKLSMITWVLDSLGETWGVAQINPVPRHYTCGWGQQL